MEKKTILMEVHGRPDLTRDLSYGVGRAVHRVVKRVKGLPDDTLVDFTCADTDSAISFHAGTLRAPGGLHHLMTWLAEQAQATRYSMTSYYLDTLLADLKKIKPAIKPRIFLDMDGVFADFDLGYPTLFGHHHTAVSPDEMWVNVDSDPDFYAKLAVMPHAAQFYQAINHLPHDFLSVTRTDAIGVAKCAFLRNTLKSKANLLPVWGGPKSKWMANKGDILIDDHEVNIDDWNKCGGVGILHEDFESTAHKLTKILGAPNG